MFFFRLNSILPASLVKQFDSQHEHTPLVPCVQHCSPFHHEETITGSQISDKNKSHSDASTSRGRSNRCLTFCGRSRGFQPYFPRWVFAISIPRSVDGSAERTNQNDDPFETTVQNE